MSLSKQIVIGVVLGFALGVFVGEYAAVLEPAADAYVKLLQMTVLPYVLISLISGLGGLRLTEVRTLAARCGLVLLGLWAVALAAVVLFPMIFPAIESASFFSTTLIAEKEPFDFVSLYIPANPFHSLANNIVPAVVLFGVVLGIALIGVPDKERLLSVLSVVRAMVSRATSFLVGLTPYGLFAVVAVAAGTLGVEALRQVSVYLISYIAVSLFVCLWALPALVAALTPIPYRAVLTRTRDALFTAFATGSLFIVLPALTDAAKALIRDYQNVEVANVEVADVIMPASFSFPHGGKLLSLSFVLFAGWAAEAPVPLQDYPRLAVTGVLALFGNMNGAVPFLLDTFRIPADTFQMFLTTGVINARFGTLVAAVHTLAFGVLGTCAVVGMLRLNVRKMTRYAATTVALAAVTVVGSRALATGIAGGAYSRDQELTSMRMRREYPAALVRRAPYAPAMSTSSPASDRIAQIRARGVLRVGYIADRLPYAFFNAREELVGFDIEMAHILAGDLGVRLELLPVPRSALLAYLDGGACDVVMSGIVPITYHAAEMAFSSSYLDETLAFLVRDHARDQFASWDVIRARGHLRLAVPNLPYVLAKLRAELPGAEIVPFDSIAEVIGGKPPVDGIVYTAEGGSAWTLLHPQFSVVVPGPRLMKMPLAYPVAARDQALANLISTWIELKRKDGTVEELYAHWILGRDATPKSPRWSIARDVLHWIS